LTIDIRNETAVHEAIAASNPEIVLHLAAQSLVRPSYEQPIETLATNIMGTAHILNAIRDLANCRAVVCVTSDKCYENREWHWPYRENEPMGGHDPYSSSKGAAELIIASFRSSFFANSGAQIGSARAGNVIGGGDWAVDRLIPDCIRAFQNDNAVEIRNPAATRPWQHVLEPLSGYLLLAERLATRPGEFDEGWNFGPRAQDVRPVEYLVDRIQQLWGADAKWKIAGDAQLHEATALNVDASKAIHRLGWAPRLSVDEALAWTVDWHKQVDNSNSVEPQCMSQIEQYTMLANRT
jgi:CDP-glucose 4,6-dehydratase